MILVRPYNSKDFLLIYEIEAIRLIKSDITDHFFKRNNIRVLLTKSNTLFIYRGFTMDRIIRVKEFLTILGISKSTFYTWQDKSSAYYKPNFPKKLA